MASTATTATAGSAFSPNLCRRRGSHLLLPPRSHSAESARPSHSQRRRSLLLSSSAAFAASSLFIIPRPSSAADAEVAAEPDRSPAVTDRVFMDFSICPSYLRSDRPLGFDLAACPDLEPLGRVVFGLYGKLLPRTVTNFKTVCAAAAYRGTLVHKVLRGQFFMVGRQGRREKGEVRPPPGLERNLETVDPKAFQLKHMRPGTLSLCLSENDDDDQIKLDPDYHNLEFLVTTGPGPCPQLDNQNIVFGAVLDGLDVITSIAATPTYLPAERIRQFNDFAEFIGDERAQSARTMWNRPLKAIYISDCGELKVAKPSLSPILP